jgi:HEAT repeat protein
MTRFSWYVSKQSSSWAHFPNDPDVDARITAARASATIQAREHAPAVVKLLQDSRDHVRGAAAEDLGAMQAKERILTLVKLP